MQQDQQRPSRAAWMMRLPEDLAEKIDKRAREKGISRNAWVIRALSWAVQRSEEKRS